MSITVERLDAAFGAAIRGVDLTRPLDGGTFRAIREAFDEHSVLVFPNQPVDDAQQVAFSERFGPLETTVKANPAAGSYFARQSNIDMATGAVIPPDHRRMMYQKANMLWHSDSSFKPVPALCSLLSARIVPPEGGDTEFASLRLAYAELPEETKARIEDLVAEHSLAYSRSQVAPNLMTAEEIAEVPPVRQLLVRENPANGRKNFYVGAHASHIVGWPEAEGRALIRELIDFGTQPRFCYVHSWHEGDLVLWDNRCCLHRATPYDTVRFRRLMQRTTVAGDRPTVPV